MKNRAATPFRTRTRGVAALSVLEDFTVFLHAKNNRRENNRREKAEIPCGFIVKGKSLYCVRILYPN